MNMLGTRWITLLVCVLASVPIIALAGGTAFWIALVLPLLGWLVAARPDSLWPLGWISVALIVWFTGGSGLLWHAAVFAVAIAAVHFTSVIGARASNRAKGWMRTDLLRFAVYLAAVAAAMGVVALVTLLPPLEGLIWVIGAVVLFGAVVVAVRLNATSR